MPLTENDIRDAYFDARKMDMLDPEFHMSPWTWCEVCNIKDDNGRFLWQNAMLDGDRDRLLNLPVNIDRTIPDGEVRLQDRWDTITIRGEIL